MNNDLSPANMLKLYRAHSSPDQKTQAKLFLQLPPEERLEMLFYMNVHLVAALQNVHARVDETAAATTDIAHLKGH